MGKNRKTNEHHLIQKCDGGSNHNQNTEQVRINKHDGLHWFCGVDYTLPSDKVLLMLDFHKKVIDADVYNDVRAIINEWRANGRDTYNPQCIKNINKFDMRVKKSLQNIK